MVIRKVFSELMALICVSILSGCGVLSGGQSNSEIQSLFAPGAVRTRSPDRLEKRSGDGQSAVAGRPLDSGLKLLVKDVYGDPVSGAQVAGVILSGGGSLSSSSVFTDTDGIASFTWTLGPEPGSQSVSFSGVGEYLRFGGPLVFSATATADSPSLSYAGSSGTSVVVNSPMSVIPSTLAANGAPVETCMISPALPAGLSIHHTTCVISGTPTEDFQTRTFTVSATNDIGTTTATVSLETRIPCPTGFAQVIRNTAVGVSNSFCIAKYEMRCVGSGCPTPTPVPSSTPTTYPNSPGPNTVATSQATGYPWVNLSIQNAQAACQALGSNYDLVSNAEWMATARQIEAYAPNWSLGAVGQGTLSTGWSNATFVQGNANSSCLYNSGPNTCGSIGSFEFKRTLGLSTTEEIWDFSGNTDEWVDWSMAAGIQSSPTLCTGVSSWLEIPNLNCSGLPGSAYLPANPAGISASSYNSSYRLGQVYIPGTAGLFAVRGGKYNHSAIAGIFNLAIRSDGAAFHQIGFRCVQRVYHPALSFTASGGTSGTAGQSMTVTPTITNLVGGITGCTVSPALPAGLSIHPTTCVISGIPTQAIGNTAFTVNATNSYGSTQAIVNMTVVAARPSISYSGATGTSGTRNVLMNIAPTTFAVNGAGVTTCTTSPALPAGLSISNTTCVISGTPSVVSASSTYTVTATNSAGSTSATVNLWTCPTNFIPVDISAENSGFGVSPFCVAKYEMKCVGSDCTGAHNTEAINGPGTNAVATSRPNGLPWYRPPIAHARTGCSNLNAINGVINKYRLPLNAHWMTIARSIERNGANWSSGVAGDGQINMGHTDGSPAGYLSVVDPNDPYDGTGNSSSSGWNQKRTHQLLNGQVIWDFGGNVTEWLDWDVPQVQKPYVLSDGSTIGAVREFFQLDALVGQSDPFYIELIRPYHQELGIAQGLGGYHGGSVDFRTAIARRGLGGIYGLNVGYDDADLSLSFRCVYQP